MRNKNTISLKTENGLVNLVQNETFGTIHINELGQGKPYQNICSISNSDLLAIIRKYIKEQQ